MLTDTVKCWSGGTLCLMMLMGAISLSQFGVLFFFFVFLYKIMKANWKLIGEEMQRSKMWILHTRKSLGLINIILKSLFQMNMHELWTVSIFKVLGQDVFGVFYVEAAPQAKVGQESLASTQLPAWVTWGNTACVCLSLSLALCVCDGVCVCGCESPPYSKLLSERGRSKMNKLPNEKERRGVRRGR